METRVGAGDWKSHRVAEGNAFGYPGTGAAEEGSCGRQLDAKGATTRVAPTAKLDANGATTRVAPTAKLDANGAGLVVAHIGPVYVPGTWEVPGT